MKKKMMTVVLSTMVVLGGAGNALAAENGAGTAERAGGCWKLFGGAYQLCRGPERFQQCQKREAVHHRIILHRARKVGELKIRRLLTENAAQLLRREHVVFALHAVAVRVLPAVKAAERIRQLRKDVVQRAADDLPTICALGLLVSFRVDERQKRVVVEHFPLRS